MSTMYEVEAEEDDVADIVNIGRKWEALRRSLYGGHNQNTGWVI